MTEVKKKRNEDIEEVFKHVGEFGPYQLILFIFISMCAFVCSMVSYSFTFYGAVPSHRCKLPESLLFNDTFEIQGRFHEKLVNEYIPLSSNHILSAYDKCNLKNFTVSNDTSSNFSLVHCNEWIYSTEYYKETFVSEEHTN
jgi:hypothetical protein